jgi:hypothetical protein
LRIITHEAKLIDNYLVGKMGVHFHHHPQYILYFYPQLKSIYDI